MFVIIQSITLLLIASCFRCQEVWVTTADESWLLHEDIITGQGSAGSGPVFEVFPENRDQYIMGFGAAISNAAAHNLYNEASSRQDLLEDLFDPVNGIGISYIRLVMGGSDFNAVDPYTYDDMPEGEEDFAMEFFSIEKDKDFVIPLLKEILDINSNIRIMASPWSAPAWMKSPESLHGGSLKFGDEYHQALADYFVQFVQAYEAEGISIDTLTLQNEPEHASGGYPTMLMTWEEQRDIIKNHLGPKFEGLGINTDIVIWDHNWDNTDYATNILDDPDARRYVSGSGWHCYAGNRDDPSKVRADHPDKDLHFTECSGGEWDSDFSSSFIWNLENLFIGQTRIGARTVLLWNMALDENLGPRVGVTGGCSDCRGVVTVHTTSGNYDKELEYYAIGHLSKFVRPSARSIEIDPVNEDWVDVGAYINTDGSVVVVVLNTNWDDDREFNILLDGTYYNYSLTPRSAATFVL